MWCQFGSLFRSKTAIIRWVILHLEFDTEKNVMEWRFGMHVPPTLSEFNLYRYEELIEPLTIETSLKMIIAINCLEAKNVMLALLCILFTHNCYSSRRNKQIALHHHWIVFVWGKFFHFFFVNKIFETSAECGCGWRILIREVSCILLFTSLMPTE